MLEKIFTLLAAATLVAGCQRPSPDETAPVEPSHPSVEDEPATVGAEAEPPAPTRPRPVEAPEADDEGVFSELDDKVRVVVPSWLDTSAALKVANRHGDVFLYVDGRPVGFAPPDDEPDIVLDTFEGADIDEDSIPDELDVLLGAKKTVVNDAKYGSPYREIEFPGGDVPREEGVCTDTLVRSVRNAGRDLQKTLYEDIGRRPRAFPMVRKRNPNIDHRRVKTLLPHFQGEWSERSIDPEDVRDPWMPGDVVFMQFFGDARPDHVGIVSDRLGSSGAPLIINNYTDGFTVAEMDIATMAPITHRFRIASRLTVPAEHAGLAGVLSRAEVRIPDDSRQVVLVTVPGWNSPYGSLRRFRRTETGFELVGDVVPVTVGAEGVGHGRGLHGDEIRGDGPAKSEGDRRAPVGVFRLGTAFGRANSAPGSWTYRRVDDDDYFVDDPASEHYNRWHEGRGEWSSAERLSMYELGVVVKHNDARVAGAGSAIFLHTWQGEPAPTLGCTAMEKGALRALVGWLEPDANPVFVQVPGQFFDAAD